MKNKVIVAGSRDIDNWELVFDCINNYGIRIDEIVCGQAKGVDTCGMYYGFDHSIPVKYFPADWRLHGKAAGPIRNLQMVEYANAGIFVINKFSSGSMHCMKAMKAAQKQFICYHITKDDDKTSETYDLVSIETENGTIEETDPRFIAAKSRIAAHSVRTV